MVRPKMVYDWDNKRDICFDMYITQNMPLEEVIDHFRDEKSFTPRYVASCTLRSTASSVRYDLLLRRRIRLLVKAVDRSYSKRAFQARFKEWDFPAKHRRAHKEASLEIRIRELWEVNTSNKQMLDILRGEGWDVKERELTKLRKAQGLLMREANRSGYTGVKKRKRDALEELANQNGQRSSHEVPIRKRVGMLSPELELAPEIIAKREARQARIAAESEERFRTRTRRRRTKVWAGLPPDPAQPPRYPSELTLEESKHELGVNKAQYQELRELFEDICRNHNVIKKTLCGPDTWKGVKDELISRIPHLQALFWGLNAASVGQTQRPMALDVICLDVTKKIRTIQKRVTITDAKNILGVTPQEGREIRAAFAAILKGDYFTSKLEVPREYWDNLKAKWIAESPLLQQKLGDENTDPDYAAKLRSLESIASDVQKRHRDDQTKRDPSRLSKSLKTTQNVSTNRITANAPTAVQSFGSDGAPNGTIQHSSMSRQVTRSNNPPMHDFSDDPLDTSSPANGMSMLASQALVNASYPSYDYSGMQIDPSLLQAASLPQHNHNQHYDPAPLKTNTIQSAIPVYFRVAPSSSHQYVSSAKKLWLDTFHPPHTVVSLRSLTLVRSGLGRNSNARVGRIEGVQPASERCEGGSWAIDEDDELEAFLGMVEEGKKANFLVEIL